MTRTLALVLSFLVIALVLVVNLTILDVFTVEEMKDTASDLVAVGAVTAAGLIALMALLRIARSGPGDDDEG
jgi:hypothetical protein